MLISGWVPVQNLDGRPGSVFSKICSPNYNTFAKRHRQLRVKVLTLIYCLHIGQAPRCLRDLVRLPSSAISLRPLCSLDRHDLYVP